VIPDVLVGTLGKAFGSYGAFAAGTRELTQFLLNRSRSFIFTTGIPPGIAAASITALALVRSPAGETLRAQLAARVQQFRAGLARMELLAPATGATPIFPVQAGTEEQTMRASQVLMDRGVYAQGIRPPTVPRGTSRLRFALMASHTERDVDTALAALEHLTAIGLLDRNSSRRGVD
jgi:7-keto-8-aminopelargonate synthetase-like enzyme